MATSGSPSVNRHKRMYKAGSPAWKETFRKRCVDRLKKSRGKFVDRLRNLDPSSASLQNQAIVQDVMAEEWEQLQQENADLPRMKKHTLHLEDGEDASNINEILSIFEEIQKELLTEEQLMLQEYEKNQGFDEADLCNAVASMCNEITLCPVCQKNHLMQNKSIIFCKCGVRIDTELDCLTISDMKSQMEEGNRVHSQNCGETPRFSVINEMGFQNLLMSCPACDFMFIVI